MKLRNAMRCAARLRARCRCRGEIFLWSKSANLVKCLWVLCVKRIFVWRVIRHHYRHGKLVECIIIIISAKHKRRFRQCHATHKTIAPKASRYIALPRRRWRFIALNGWMTRRAKEASTQANRNIMYITVSSRYLMRSPCNYALTNADAYVVSLFDGRDRSSLRHHHSFIPSLVVRSGRTRAGYRISNFVFIASNATKKLHWPWRGVGRCLQAIQLNDGEETH